MKYQPSKNRNYGVNLCEGCLEKQRAIDRLREEVQRLKAQLNQRQRKQQEGIFGSSTPSSLKPIKANSDQDKRANPGGAKGTLAMGGVPAQQMRRMKFAGSS